MLCSTSRTSNSSSIRRMRTIVPGLEPSRWYLAHHCRNCSSPTLLGATTSSRTPRPQPVRITCSTSSSTAAAHADQHRLLRADLVEHRVDVVEPLLERGHLVARKRVGDAGAALVEHDQAAERAEAVEERRESRLFPLRLDGVP